MFIFRFIRTILWIIGLGTVIYWGWQYFNEDTGLKQQVQDFRKSPVYKEGMKDLKTWAGEAIKGVGEKLEDDDVTAEERRELDKILEQELKRSDTKDQVKIKRVKTIQVRKEAGKKEARQ